MGGAPAFVNGGGRLSTGQATFPEYAESGVCCVQMARTLSTVDSAVRILELFDADHTEWSLSELARELRQPTSTVHEQLLTLTASGLLLRVERGRYRLGWRLLKLSSALYGSLPWYSLAHTAMERVARGTQLLAFVAVVEGEQVLCIARSVQGRDGGEVMGETDFDLPPHATASGKLLLGWLGLPMPAAAETFTANTIWTEREWLRETQAIRAGGFAQSMDEWALGTSGLAVPLLGEGGTLLAALGISLPSAKMRQRESLLRQLRDAADEVSWALGYRPERSIQ